MFFVLTSNDSNFESQLLINFIAKFLINRLTVTAASQTCANVKTDIKSPMTIPRTTRIGIYVTRFVMHSTIVRMELVSHQMFVNVSRDSY